MKTRIPAIFILILLVAFAGILPGAAMPGLVIADSPVYTDSLAAGWEDWSWGGINAGFANSNPVHSGAKSISVTYTGAWSGLQVGYHSANLDVSAYDTFRFWIHGGLTGGQTILLQIGSLEQAITPQANTWTRTPDRRGQ